MTITSAETLSAIVLRLLKARKPPHVSGNDAPHAYASEAGACARQIGYRLTETPCGTEGRDDSLPAHIAFSIGDYLHDFVQRGIKELYPDASFEYRWDLGYLSGRADGLYTRDGEKTVVEIKSTAAGTFGKVMSSPYYSHVMQASISAVVLGAELIHLVYVNKSSRSDVPGLIEFILPVDKDRTKKEILRLRQIVTSEDDIRYDRIDGEGNALDPTKSKYPCGWCRYREICMLSFMQERGMIAFRPA